jgi:hypothetical protein
MASRHPSPWLAVDSVSDRVRHALALRRLYEASRGGELAPGLRAVVAQSWARSGQAGIDPERHLPPVLMEEREIEARWAGHPLYPVLPVLRRLLSDATTESGHMLVISDARGVLLWIEGHRRVIEATESMHFVCGADWSESGAGTNALGTAIAVDHPVQIFSAEHFNRIVHPWQCSGAPIHDPETGEIVGVIDLTGHLRTAHPHTLSLVTAAAGMAEAYLRQEIERRDARLRETYLSRVGGSRTPSALVRAGGRVLLSLPGGWPGGVVDPPRGGGEIELPDGSTAVAEPLAGEDAFIVWKQAGRSTAERGTPPALRLELLATPPRASLRGRRMAISQRHAEILAVLALSPRGLTAEQLTLELYGERGKPVTVRAEVSRLRPLMAGLLQARPYRLLGDISADFLDVERLLEDDRVADALDRYPQPLLAGSEVPLVVEARDRLDATLRRAVIQSGDPTLIARWCATPSGRDDLHAAELLLSLLDERDARLPAARARAARLRATG